MIKKLVVAITGSSGVVYGVRLLEVLKGIEKVETHLILSEWAKRTIEIELDVSVQEVMSLADVNYGIDDMEASVSSGSFMTCGMIIIPCSMKTLAAVANGFNYNLIVRAADVTLKESRRLVIVPRETPLTAIHLENMLKLARAGAVIVPPIPAFYYQPKSIADIVDHLVGKVLDQFAVEHNLFRRWGG